MSKATVRCPKCGHDEIVITETLDSDLALLLDAQAAESERLRELIRIGSELAGHVTRSIALAASFDRDVLRYWAQKFHDQRRAVEATVSSDNESEPEANDAD